MLYMHLLTWVGVGLIGYVPNTLYKLISATTPARVLRVAISTKHASKNQFVLIKRRSEQPLPTRFAARTNVFFNRHIVNLFILVVPRVKILSTCTRSNKLLIAPREDRRNLAKGVKPLHYGPFSSYAPSYDGTFATLTKDESHLIYHTLRK
jgi:hypothetical protein